MISLELEPAEEFCRAGDVPRAVGVVGLGGRIRGLGLGSGRVGLLLLVLVRLMLRGEVICGGRGHYVRRWVEGWEEDQRVVESRYAARRLLWG